MSPITAANPTKAGGAVTGRASNGGGEAEGVGAGLLLLLRFIRLGLLGLRLLGLGGHRKDRERRGRDRADRAAERGGREFAENAVGHEESLSSCEIRARSVRASSAMWPARLNLC